MSFQVSKVIGHRGACGYAPENTKVSMRKARELGTTWVEFDVMLAGCGEIIIMHDETLDRTTNGKGEVCKTSYLEMMNLDAGSWYGAEFANEKIVTFKEMLLYLKELGLEINIEIKPTQGKDIITAERVLKELYQHWNYLESQPLLSSFSEQVLKTLHHLDPNIKLGYLVDTWPSQWQRIVTEYNCFSLNINQAILNKKKVKLIKKQGLCLLCYTVNESKRAKQLFDWGVDGIFSDVPDVILQSLDF